MKKLILCLTGIILCNGLFSQENPGKNYWTSGTAFTVQKHRLEAGLFTLSGYGITDKIELQAHPLMVFLMPQVKVNVGWGGRSGFQLATEHGILYPSFFMKTVAMKGTGGLISPELAIPQMLAVTNRALISVKPLPAVLLTASAGITFSVNSASSDHRSTIEMPIIYPRLASFYSNPEFELGIDFRGKFSDRYGWLFSVENFFLAGTPYNYFFENKGVMAYNSKKESLRIEAGYKLCYGKYPDGNRWHLLPDINLIFGFGR